MPKIFEEGLLFYKQTKKDKPIDLSQSFFSSTTLNNMQNFSDILRQYNGNIYAAQNQLKNLYRDTYWYYLIYMKPSQSKENKKQ